MVEKSDAEKILADAEREALELSNEIRETAHEEAAKIINAAAEDARRQMIRHGESVARDGGVQRLIEFLPENRHAGIAILSYFSEVLRQKYPDEEMAVRIEQFGSLVRMTIDGPTGWRDIIERDLAVYGDVVVGKVAPEALLRSEIGILRLRNKLDLARTELEFERRVNAISTANSDARIASLEDQLERMHGAIAMSLSSRGGSGLDIAALMAQQSSNEVVREALQLLDKQLSKSVTLDDRAAVEAAAKTIGDRDPSLLKRIYDFLSSSSSGAAGALLASWIQGLLK
ncbi:ATP synthase subunit B family protein [Paraburkholderia oxyphila]|uniref:hypothetical protein n=1 Tax=Paraburkholderia oxyphila TaxID=614212 RepID=UPI00048029C5|nr:hypothetical protein [Paraburkholderia oxyphila]